GAAKAVFGLATKLPLGVAENAYWRLVRGLAEFRDVEACEYLGSQICKGKTAGITRDLMFALQSNHTQAVLELHRKVLAKGPIDLQEMAAEQVGRIRLVASVDLLIDALEREEKRRGSTLVARILRSLRRLTDADCGPAHAWRGWWEARREKGVPSRRERSGTGTVVDHVDPFDSAALEKMEARHLLVLTCCYVPEVGEETEDFDHIEELLSEMKVPHTVVRRKDFEKPDYRGLREAWILCVNCTNTEDHCVNPEHEAGAQTGMRMHECDGPGAHKIVNHRLSAAAVQKIKAFVTRGGYLFTEDWGLCELLEEAWPHLVASHPHYAKTDEDKEYLPEMTVDVVAGRGETSNPMLRGVWRRETEEESSGGTGEGGGTVPREPPPTAEELLAKHAWVIDEDSPALAIKNRRIVRALMVSPELKKHTQASSNDSVVVTFFPAGARKTGGSATPTGRYLGQERPNGGRVLHVVSHFGRQVSKQDEFALQRLLVNFLLEANRRVPASPQGRER
ncbi:hypothetical protein ACFL59_14100, partial [Planctomycetota bacterium]